MTSVCSGQHRIEVYICSCLFTMSQIYIYIYIQCPVTINDRRFPVHMNVTIYRDRVVCKKSTSSEKPTATITSADNLGSQFLKTLINFCQTI